MIRFLGGLFVFSFFPPNFSNLVVFYCTIYLAVCILAAVLRESTAAVW